MLRHQPSSSLSSHGSDCSSILTRHMGPGVGALGASDKFSMASRTLVQLPDALQLHILQQLRDDLQSGFQPTCNNLLRTNHQLRRMASACINHMRIEFRLKSAFAPNTQTTDVTQGEAALASHGLQQIKCFPRYAMLTHLHLSNACNAIFHGHASLLLKSAPAGRRLSLRHLTLANFMLTGGDMATITHSCPNLTSLRLQGGRLSGEAFNALPDLVSLQLLSMQGVDIRDASTLQGLTGLAGVRGLEWAPPQTPPHALSRLVPSVISAAAAMPALQRLRLCAMPEGFSDDSWGSTAGAGNGRGAPGVLPACTLPSGALSALSACVSLQEFSFPTATLDFQSLQVLAQLPRLKTLRVHSLELPSSCPWREALKGAQWQQLELQRLDLPGDALRLSAAPALVALRVQQLHWQVRCRSCRLGSHSGNGGPSGTGRRASRSLVVEAERGALAGAWLGPRLQLQDQLRHSGDGGSTRQRRRSTGTESRSVGEGAHLIIECAECDAAPVPQLHVQLQASEAQAAADDVQDGGRGQCCSPALLLAAVASSMGRAVKELTICRMSVDGEAAQQLLSRASGGGFPSLGRLNVCEGRVVPEALPGLLQMAGAGPLRCLHLRCVAPAKVLQTLCSGLAAGRSLCVELRTPYYGWEQAKKQHKQSEAVAREANMLGAPPPTWPLSCKGYADQQHESAAVLSPMASSSAASVTTSVEPSSCAGDSGHLVTCCALLHHSSSCPDDTSPTDTKHAACQVAAPRSTTVQLPAKPLMRYRLRRPCAPAVTSVPGLLHTPPAVVPQTQQALELTPEEESLLPVLYFALMFTTLLHQASPVHGEHPAYEQHPTPADQPACEQAGQSGLLSPSMGLRMDVNPTPAAVSTPAGPVLGPHHGPSTHADEHAPAALASASAPLPYRSQLTAELDTSQPASAPITRLTHELELSEYGSSYKATPFALGAWMHKPLLNRQDAGAVGEASVTVQGPSQETMADAMGGMAGREADPSEDDVVGELEEEAGCIQASQSYVCFFRPSMTLEEVLKVPLRPESRQASVSMPAASPPSEASDVQLFGDSLQSSLCNSSTASPHCAGQPAQQSPNAAPSVAVASAGCSPGGQPLRQVSEGNAGKVLGGRPDEGTAEGQSTNNELALLQQQREQMAAQAPSFLRCSMTLEELLATYPYNPSRGNSLGPDAEHSCSQLGWRVSQSGDAFTRASYAYDDGHGSAWLDP